MITLLKKYNTLIVFFLLQILLRLFLSYHLPASEILMSRRIIFIILGCLADSFLLTLLYIAYIFLKFRIIKLLYSFWWVYAILISVTNNILILNTFNIINPNIMQLILDNLNEESIRGVIGNYFCIYILLLLFILLTLYIYVYQNGFSNIKDIKRKEILVLILICVLGGYSSSEKVYPQNGIYAAYDLRGWIWQPALNSTYKIFFGKEVKIKLIHMNLTKKDKEVLENIGIISTEKKEKVTNKFKFNNVVLIIAESLDKNYINYYNKQIPASTTQFLNYCSSHYLSMNNYFTASITTDNGINAILNSRLNYYVDRDICNNDYSIRSILSVANQNGYDTYFIRGSSKAYGDHDIYYSRLFQMKKFITTEYFFEHYGLKGKQWGIEDKYLFNEAIKILEQNQEQKNFIVINTIDTHPPYRDYEKILNNNKFLNALNYLDINLNNFYNNLKNNNLFNDETLIIITADHSAVLGANYTKRNNFEPDRIPLIFLTSNKDIYIDIDSEKYCSQIDLAPTIMDLLGWSKTESMMGNSILDKNNISITKYQNDIILRSNSHKRIINLQNDKNNIISKWYYHYY